MRPRLVIPRIIDMCPSFEGRVSGAWDFPRAFGNEDLPVPHAFVMLAGLTSSGEDLISNFDQEVNTQLTVAVCVSTETGEDGFDASEQLLSLLVELRDALLGWTPEPEKYGPIMLDGLTLMEGEMFTRARAWASVDLVSAFLFGDLV